MAPGNSRNNGTICLGMVLLVTVFAALLHVRSAAQEAAQTRGVILVPAERTAPQAWRLMLEELERAFGGEWETTEGYAATADRAGGRLIEFCYMESDVSVRNARRVKGRPRIDAYVIRSGSTGAVKHLRVYAPQERGLLYGGFYLAERARIDPQQVWLLNVTRVPAYSVRLAGDSPANALRLGYNTVFADGTPASLALFKKAKPAILPPGSPGYERTQRNRARLASELREHDAYLLDSCIVTDEFLFPRELIFSPYRAEVTERDFQESELENTLGLGRIFCFAKERLWQLYRMKYREVLTDFPQLDYVMLRLGEHRTAGKDAAYVGNGVYALGSNLYCEDCRSISYEERIARTIRETYNVVVNQCGRRYIHRTWDLRTDAFNNNPAVFRSILARLPATDGLMFSTKYTYGDFWEYFDFNPTIAVGNVPRIAEFQCTREYEGKGAFPNFLGEEFAAAYQYLRGKPVTGIWNWHHGGGQGGPVVANDLWNQANIYAAAHLMWDPNTSAETLATEWATLYFGADAAPLIVQLLLLSDDAVRHWRYFERYSSNHKNWAPAELWVRDDKIRGDRALYPIYRECRSHVDELIEEKDHALKEIEMMQELLEQAKPSISSREQTYLPWLSDLPPARRFISGADLYAVAESSLQYEYVLASVLRHYASAYFYTQRYRDTLEPVMKERAAAELAAWQDVWTSYTTTIPQLPFSASLYTDDGMIATIEKVRYYLEHPERLDLNWWIIGPFDNRQKRGFDAVYPPEHELNLAVQYAGLTGDVRWRPLPEECVIDDFINMDPAFTPDDWITMYALTQFRAPQEQEAELRVGSDDAIKIWLNGELVHQNNVYRAAKPGEDVTRVRVRAGTNTLLVKLMEGILGCGFYIQLTSPDGAVIKGLQPVSHDAIRQSFISEMKRGNAQ
jgi:hypothetical protein